MLLTAEILGYGMYRIGRNLAKDEVARYWAEYWRCIERGPADLSGVQPQIYTCKGESEAAFWTRINAELSHQSLYRLVTDAGVWIMQGAVVIAVLCVLILGLRKFFSRTIAVSIVQGENRKVSNVEAPQDGEPKNVQELLKQIDNLFSEGKISESEHATARLKVISENGKT